MTIPEFMKIAIHGYPKDEFRYYKPYFLNMDCEHCIYNGYSCKNPKTEGVCMDYTVSKKHMEFVKPNSRHEKKA